MLDSVTKYPATLLWFFSVSWRKPLGFCFGLVLSTACVTAFAVDTLTVDGRSVSYWPSAEGGPFAEFQLDTQGYRNTYTLDCEKRQFLWTNNVLISTGQATGNNVGSEWKPLNPDSTTSNAVYEATCPRLLSKSETPPPTMGAGSGAARAEGSGQPASALASQGTDPASQLIARIEAGDIPTVKSILSAVKYILTVEGYKTISNDVLRDKLIQKAGGNFVYSKVVDAFIDIVVDTIDERGSFGAGCPFGAFCDKYVFKALLTTGKNMTLLDWKSQLFDQVFVIAQSWQETRAALDDLPCVDSLPAEEQEQLKDLYWLKEKVGSSPPLGCGSALDGGGGKSGGDAGGDTAPELQVSESTQAPRSPDAGAESSGGTATADDADRIELKDGDVLIGRTKAGKIPFASSFGTIDVDFVEVQSFADEELHLADGSVVKGQFGEGTIQIATTHGELTIPVQNIVSIARGSGGPHAATATISPQAGQGILTGRVVDNFGQPISSAGVQISGTSLSTETVQDGGYQIPYVPGEFVVRIERSGYDPAEFDLQLAQASTYPVEDKTLVKSPPGNEVYFLGEKDWVSLSRCTVEQTQSDSRDIQTTGTSSFAARGSAPVIVVEGSAEFLDATGGGSSLLLYRVEDDDTIIRLERSAGLTGFSQLISRRGPAPGAIDMDMSKIGADRPVYGGALGAGVYAFVQKPSGAASVIYPADICFKFEVKKAGQLLREQAEQAAAQYQPEAGATVSPAVALEPGDDQTEAALNLDRDQRRQVQAWLNALGFGAGTPDGLFGGGTRGALSAFQRSVGVTDSGYLSDSQYQHLRAQGGRVLAEQAVSAIEAGLVPIPAGCFQMGTPASEPGRGDSESSPRRVCVKDFKLARFEVTVKEFRVFVMATGYRTDAERGILDDKSYFSADVEPRKELTNWRNHNRYQANLDNHPVVSVTGKDVQAFLDWLNEMSNSSYRLPTEAEWEYAARAGTTAARFWGDSLEETCRYANVKDRAKFFRKDRRTSSSWSNTLPCTDGYFFVAPVGSYRPNHWGLYDMLGNVEEWVDACHEDSEGLSQRDDASQATRICSLQVHRGGNWRSGADHIRSAYRGGLNSAFAANLIGFRVAKTD